MLVSDSKKKKKTKIKKTTKNTTKKKTPYVICWIVYKIDRFLGNCRKPLWLLLKMQFFISLQKKKGNTSTYNQPTTYTFRNKRWEGK